MASTDDSMQVNSSDLIATKLVSNVFDGNGFTGWKRGMLIALSAKNKLGFGQMNGAQLYGIHKKLNDFSQGNDSIWDEIDAMGMNPSCVCTCACGAAEKQKKFRQDQRVVQFLMCLNDTYSVIKSAILMRNPLRSLGVVYNNLLQEERQREIQSSVSNFQTNSASFYAKGGKPYSSRPQMLTIRMVQFTEGKFRTIQAIIFNLDEEKSNGVNNELCSRFMKVLKEQQQQQGMPNSDSSATSNFTGTTVEFSVLINTLGPVMLTPDICLRDVMFVPSFKFNLLSISKLAKQLQTTIFFTPEICSLQVSSMRKPIILGKSHKNLYVFQQGPIPSATKSSFSNSDVINDYAQTWHSRLGHLPLYKLKKLSFFNTSKINEIDFHSCSICAKARQHRLPFLDSHIQTSDAFEFIHIDL
ncbi:hypothetical protein RND81_13G038200 [Saponaria officinalis]|uniref:GAG-pre-integrase domain-containing protein n=1 Tax=Saponaria officinalis TaxID=3572 RepID=A0AAW1GTR7_SAPOF